MSNKVIIIFGVLCAAVAATASSTAAVAAPIYANAFFEIYLHLTGPSNFPSGLLEEDINLDNASNVNTVTGTTDTTGKTVQFTSNTKLDSASGAATIKAADNGTYNDLSISVPGNTFTDLIFTVTLEKPGKDEGPNSLSVEAFGANGSSLGSFSGFDPTDLEAANNSILILALNPTLFSSILLTSPVGIVSAGTGIEQTKQFEISGVTAVPLPAALPLFAGGLGLLGWMARRRRRQAAHI